MAGQIKIEIVGDTKKLSKSVNDVDGILGKMGGKISAWSVASGQLLADGISKGLGAAAGYLQGAIGAASDLGETVSKVGVLFADQAPEIQKFADGAAKALGQTKQQALDAAATFAVFGKSAGLGGKDLTRFSTQLVTLSSDLASFSNTSPEEAIDAIGAALRGESEPIRKYGIMLDAAAVKAKAVSLGLVTASVDSAKLSTATEAVEKAQRKANAQLQKYGENSTEASDAARDLEQAQAKLADVTEGSIPDLTAAQKILATQELIYDQTKDAQGDFARTSGGLANQQRILAAQLGNVKTEIGQKLLPAVLRITKWFNDEAIPAAQKYGPVIARVFDQVVGYVRTVIDLFQSGGWKAGLGKIAQDLGEVLGNLGGWIKDTVLPAVGSALESLGKAFGNWVKDTAVPWLLEKLGEWLTALGDWATGTAKPWIEAKAAEFATALADWVVASYERLKANLPGWIETFGAWATGTALPWILEKAVEFRNALADWVFQAAEDLAANLPGWIATFEVWAATEALPALTRFGIDAVKAIASGLDGAGDALVEAGKDMVRGLISGLWSQLSSTQQEVAAFIAAAVPGGMSLVNAIGGSGGGGGIASLDSTPRAGGGPVSAGQLYMVGEQGPEYFVPQQSGTIIPNGQGGGGGDTINIYLSGVVGDGDAVIRTIHDGLRRLERSKR